MSESPDRDAERPRQSKVGELQDVVAAIKQQVLRLEIAVEHAVGVAVGDAPQNLVEVGLHGTAQGAYSGIKICISSYFAITIIHSHSLVNGITVSSDSSWYGTSSGVQRLNSKQREREEGGGETDFDYAVVLEVGGGVHVLLQVEVEVLEDEVDALVVVHDVLQPARQRERISSR